VTVLDLLLGAARRACWRGWLAPLDPEPRRA
jgi:hypothetical protein